MTSASRAGIGLAALLAGLTMFGPFATDSMFPAFESMRRQFGVDSAAMQQVTSVYLLSFAVASLFVGPLADALGRRRVLLIGMVVFALASAGCALATNLPMLLVFRGLQGLSGGAGIVARAVVRDLFAGHQAQRVMAQIAMIFGLAPAVAPIIGGIILGFGPWPWVFWFLVIFAVAMSVWTYLRLPESLPPAARHPLHVGALLSSLWTVASEGPFLRIAFATTFSFSGQFLYIVAAPIFVVDLLGKGEQDFWIFFVPMITGMLLGSYLVGRTAGIVPANRLATIGLVFAGASGVLNVVLTKLPALALLPWSVLGPALVAFGIALAFPIMQLAMLDMFPDRLGAAASAGMFLSLLCNSLLAGLVAPLVTATRAQLAGASLAFIVVGSALWLWHLRATGRQAPLGPIGHSPD